jgi:hypothetical protein
VVVRGAGFEPGIVVYASLFADDIAVTDLTFVSATELRATFVVDAGAPSGSRVVAVANPGIGLGLGPTGLVGCPDCLTVG